MTDRPAHEVPAGYILVPLEPTEDMVASAVSELLTFGVECSIRPTLRSIYELMTQTGRME